MNETKIIAVKFQDKFRQGAFYGKDYHYKCDIDVAEGDVVDVETSGGPGIAMVTNADVPESKVDERIVPILKSVIGIHKEDEDV